MLELSGVNSFYGKAHILRDLGFSINAGEVVSLLGRNGAGKTTTVKSIMQLVKHEKGSVVFDGVELTRLPTHRVAKLGIGYVPEERRIFTDLTISENLEVGRQPPRPGVYSWTQESLFELFPNLAERRSNRGKALSGGEQRRLKRWSLQELLEDNLESNRAHDGAPADLFEALHRAPELLSTRRRVNLADPIVASAVTEDGRFAKHDRLLGEGT